STRYLPSFPTRRSSDLTTNRLGALARRSLEQYAPDLFIFAKAIGLAGANELPASALATSDLAAQLESNSEAVRKVDRSAWNWTRSEEHTSELQSHLNLV